jgi:hypothetical protein
MHARRFDLVARSVASRRTFLSGLAAAMAGAFGSKAGRAARDLGPIVVAGAPCAAVADCRQMDMSGPPRCADNGFGPDGATRCCVESGCCRSDADCCGELRCAPAPDVCNVCLRPPFPTRYVGEPCAGDDDCVPSVVGAIGCLAGACAFLDGRPGGPVTDRLDREAAMAAAEELSTLEAEGRFADLYGRMHRDARAVVPEAAVVGWYEQDFAPRGPEPARAVKVIVEEWTWDVTGQAYPDTAVVAYRQAFADGSSVRDEVRLVRDVDGRWAWFFGRDRAFVAEQVARFAR